MTTGEALYRFFNTFMTAYPAGNVPDNVQFPYMTYQMPVSAFDEGECSSTVQMWFKTDSEAVPNGKVEDLQSAIGRGGTLLHTDEGAIWIKRGNPFCVSSNFDGDKSIKLRQINITFDYLTT